MSKRFINAQELQRLSLQLADHIYADGFHPKFMIVMERGGAPIGINVHEYLQFRGTTADYVPVRTSHYTGIGQQSADVTIYGLEYLLKHANAHDSILIVDDIFDTGRTIGALIHRLCCEMRANMPQDIRVATVFYKPANNQTDWTPQYFCETTTAWIVFPHETVGLTDNEIRQHKPDMAALLWTSSSN